MYNFHNDLQEEGFLGDYMKSLGSEFNSTSGGLVAKQFDKKMNGYISKFANSALNLVGISKAGITLVDEMLRVMNTSQTGAIGYRKAKQQYINDYSIENSAKLSNSDHIEVKKLISTIMDHVGLGAPMRFGEALISCIFADGIYNKNKTSKSALKTLKVLNKYNKAKMDNLLTGNDKKYPCNDGFLLKNIKQNSSPVKYAQLQLATMYKSTGATHEMLISIFNKLEFTKGCQPSKLEKKDDKFEDNINDILEKQLKLFKDGKLEDDLELKEADADIEKILKDRIENEIEMNSKISENDRYLLYKIAYSFLFALSDVNNISISKFTTTLVTALYKSKNSSGKVDKEDGSNDSDLKRPDKSTKADDGDEEADE